MKRNKWFLGALAVVMLASIFIVAAKPSGVSHLTSLWVGSKSATSDTTVGANDVYIHGTLEVNGGMVSVTRDITFDIAGAAIDGSNDVDDASAPNVATTDNIPALIWDNSGETAAAQWTFRVPSDYSSSMVFYALVSSDDASGSGTILDWALTKNADDTGFASPTAQTGVECTSATLDASNEVLTLTVDATGQALFTAGSWITLEVFNASTADDTLELKGLSGAYTATH